LRHLVLRAAVWPDNSHSDESATCYEGLVKPRLRGPPLAEGQMRTLLLLRHAKSSWENAGLADLERPLAPRGRRTAPLVARRMVEKGWVPDLVLCSQALRVRQTWQLMAPLLGEAIPCKTLRSLYPGAPSRLLMTLQRTADEVGTLLLIGHNPGLGVLAVDLCGSGPDQALARMSAKFPTAGLAVIRFDALRWTDLASGGGRLEAFVRPKDVT
jgi:phosphohistidine phosphatase